MVHWNRFLLLLLFNFGIVGPCYGQIQDEAPLSSERVVLRTDAGDIVIALFPSIAPQHVEQFLKLVRNGIYGGTHFYRVMPGFVVQVSTGQDREPQLTEQQAQVIKKIPAEFSNLRHLRGTLSMAREDTDINSAETSFSILLGPAPHLDGKYTIFGKVVGGEAVLDEIEKAPTDLSNRPLVRISIKSADLFESVEQLKQAELQPAKALKIPYSYLESRSFQERMSVGGALLFILIVSLLLAIGDSKMSFRLRTSLNLTIALVSYFFCMISWLPMGQNTPLIASGLFIILILVIKAMGYFDRSKNY